jgi:hypothetical protein
VRRHQGSLYLIAVNNGDGKGRVTFKLPAAMQTIRELSENRVIEPDARAFTDGFEPLAVHPYEIKIP